MPLPINFPFPAERDKENKIKVRADHFDANMEYLIAQISNGLSRFGANKMQGNIDANNKTFNNLATPVKEGDAANKQYVDALITQILSRDPLLTPALVQLATQDETLSGVVRNKAVSPATLALAISSAISAASSNVPYDYLGGFELAYENNTQISIGIGQAASSDNSRTLATQFLANKDILTLWEPSNGTSDVVGCKPENVTINLWSRYNIFVISTEPQPATRGSFTTADIAANIDAFKGVSSGDLRVVIDGAAQDVTGLDFSMITSIEDIAQILKLSIAGADVNAIDNTIVFTSTTTGATSTINLTTVPGGAGTDISGANYLNVAAGTVVNGENFVYSTVDFGIDEGADFGASNLLAQDSAAYAAGYRNYRYIGYLIVGNNNQIIKIVGVNEEEAFNRDRSYRLGDYVDNVQIRDTIDATNFFSVKPGYLPCTGQISIGYVSGNYYAYYGTDGIRRFMLPDGELYNQKLQDSLGNALFGSVDLTDSITGQSVVALKLPEMERKLIAKQMPSQSNNYTWYNLYSDGYVEQGGRALASNTKKTVTLPIPMQDDLYIVNATPLHSSQGLPSSCVLDITSTSFSIYGASYQGSSGSFDNFWQVSGYAAESEYIDKIIRREFIAY